ncbi:MAG: hypothetical protein PHH83_01835 [Patescibacteria group bacterium]|nr:hypothetical protein [Patescibacteria group bacterium]
MKNLFVILIIVALATILSGKNITARERPLQWEKMEIANESGEFENVIVLEKSGALTQSQADSIRSALGRKGSMMVFQEGNKTPIYVYVGIFTLIILLFLALLYGSEKFIDWLINKQP